MSHDSRFSRLVLAIGIAWGTATFLLGYFLGFATPLGNNATQVVKSLVIAIFGFYLQHGVVAVGGVVEADTRFEIHGHLLLGLTVDI